MDMTIWLILGGTALLIVIATLLMLNRSWGDFPKRAGSLPPAGSSAPGMSRPSPVSSWEEEQPPLGTPERPVAAIEPATDADRLVPIEHPLVRQAAAQALARGGPITRYIVRDGEQLAFDFSQIDDPAQRQEAYDLLRRFNAGEHVDISALMNMVNRLFKS